MIHLLQMIHPGTVSMEVRKTKIVTTLCLAAEKRKENKTYSKFKPVKSIKLHSTKRNFKIWHSVITARSFPWKTKRICKETNKFKVSVTFLFLFLKIFNFSVWIPKKMRENKRHQEIQNLFFII